MPATALHTDLYTLTMAQSFWRRGTDELVSFEMFVRTLPDARAFLLAAGLEDVLAYLEDFAFTAQELDYLRGLPQFDDAFIDYLAGLRFTGDIVAVAEGTVLPAQAPILRVTAPRIQATIIESAVLTYINHATMIASKAARITSVCADRPVWDFSLRRLHGPDAAVTVARSSYIAGFAGTACPAAGMQLGVPVAGTMAHHYVMALGEDREQEAFEHFLEDHPDGTTLLICTYDTRRGARRAVAAALKTGAGRLQAVRIDSSDLAAEARDVRAILDEAGLTDTRIFGSNDLDEYKIAALGDAPFDAFGVGTMLGVSADAPSLGGVYKIVEQHAAGDDRYVMKKAAGKQTDPGAHQLFRTAAGRYVLGMANELIDGEGLLRTVMKAGRRTGPQPTLNDIRARAAAELAQLPAETARIDDPQPLELDRTTKLWEIRARLGDHTAEVQLTEAMV